MPNLLVSSVAGDEVAVTKDTGPAGAPLRVVFSDGAVLSNDGVGAVAH